MQALYNYRKFAILYVDDEEKSLKNFARAFSEEFRVFTALNAQEGLKVLVEHKDEIGLLMTDQRMPGEKGLWLLERARQLQPHIIRILATAYSDVDAAIGAVNTGAIYKYVTKPWEPEQLEQTLKRGLEFFQVQRERDQLLHEKMSVLHNMMIADRLVSLGLLAAGLSHHIRNSLVAVKTQVEKINSLLKDLWSASESPSFQFADRVRLHEVIGRTVAGLQANFDAKKISVDNQVSDTLPELSVDLPKFQRLFDLLLKDELASLPAGSRIIITAEARDGGAKPEIQVQISDNGPGLPQESLRVLFDPFVVRADTPAEYGIHLMACFFIVYHHGGKIEARSRAGQGTTFDLRLPLHPERAVPEPNQGLLQKSLLNEKVWEKLISSA